MSKKTVFISYAREDRIHAERLYMDLRRAELDAWMDTKCLLPGQQWKREITKAIRNSAYFIALVSEHSLNKRGYVQTEIKRALDVLSEIPNNQIFFIPARLDNTTPADEELLNLNWVDLFPDYESGLSRLLTVFSSLEKEPIVFLTPAKTETTRAPIQFTPFRSFADFAKDLLAKLPNSTDFIDLAHPIYIRYATDTPGVVIPQYLKDKHPEEITIVINYQFRELRAGNEALSVVLWFNKRAEQLVIPYSAIRDILFPTIGLRVEQFERPKI